MNLNAQQGFEWKPYKHYISDSDLKFIVVPQGPIVQVPPWLGLLQELTGIENSVIGLGPDSDHAVPPAKITNAAFVLFAIGNCPDCRSQVVRRREPVSGDEIFWSMQDHMALDCPFAPAESTRPPLPPYLNFFNIDLLGGRP